MLHDLCDLHVHTTASDGLYTPARLVQEAAALGLAAVAITDHDSVDGIDPALAAAQGSSLLVVPGLELGTDYQGVEVHLLGYYLDIRHRPLNGQLERLRRSRRERAGLMVRRLQELGYRLEPEEVAARAGGGTVGRPHVAAALVANGYVRDVDQAFAELLGRGRPAYVPRFKHSPASALALIRAAGGVAVLAHPGLYPAAAADLLPTLVAQGLGGLEVYYPAHDEPAQAFYLDLCQRLNLVATGGSDFHGPGLHGGAQLGSTGVTPAAVEELKACALPG
ncbi:MAG TPA: PHP domain-containing protein [Spirochaetia bacterium]|nr:PHP domain-containing protein [Spirochaetia bacterium]